MGLWDSASNFLSGGARNDVSQGYDDANKQLQPFVQGGQLSYGQLQQMIQQLQSQGATAGGNMTKQQNIQRNQQTQLDKYGNPADWEYSQINQSPVDLYGQFMNSYTESPEAKYAQEQALRASNAGASANGLAGSGAQLKELQENANRISQGDRQQYFNNVLNTDQNRQNYLGNFQNKQNSLNDNLLNSYTNERSGDLNSVQGMLQYLTSLGYNASQGTAQNNIGKGNAIGQIDQNSFNDVAGTVGLGASGGYDAYKNIPAYLR